MPLAVVRALVSDARHFGLFFNRWFTRASSSWISTSSALSSIRFTSRSSGLMIFVAPP